MTAPGWHGSWHRSWEGGAKRLAGSGRNDDEKRGGMDWQWRGMTVGLMGSGCHGGEGGPKDRSRWWWSPLTRGDDGGWRGQRWWGARVWGLLRVTGAGDEGNGGARVWTPTGDSEGAWKRGRPTGRRRRLSREGHQEEGGHPIMGSTSWRDEPALGLHSGGRHGGSGQWRLRIGRLGGGRGREVERSAGGVFPDAGENGEAAPEVAIWVQHWRPSDGGGDVDRAWESCGEGVRGPTGDAGGGGGGCLEEGGGL